MTSLIKSTLNFFGMIGTKMPNHKTLKPLQKHEVITLDAEEAKAFVDEMSKPVKFNAEFKKAMKEYDRRVVSK